MELGQLRCFVAVADEAHFTRAAAKLHVSQPAVSAQVRLLEHELGQPLLDRSGKGVRLTPAGSAFLPHARSVLQATEDAQRAVDELAGLVRGRLAVGMLVACALPDIPKLLAGYHRRYPAVQITLSEANSDDLLRQLEERRLDVAVVGVAGKPQGCVESLVIADELLVAAVARGDPLGRAVHHSI